MGIPRLVTMTSIFFMKVGTVNIPQPQTELNELVGELRAELRSTRGRLAVEQRLRAHAEHELGRTQCLVEDLSARLAFSEYQLGRTCSDEPT